MLINSNPSRGFQEQDAYERFEIKYDAFIKNSQMEGCPSNPFFQ